MFDAQFFKVHYRLGKNMDSMSRKLLEQAFQAIYDAGVNSDQLSGKKLGVYIGSCFSETEKSAFYIASTKTGFGIMGCSKSMFANRVSYWLNAKGPSIAVDQSCCSSIVALELAYQAMNRGDVDAALIGGASLCLLPQSSVHMRRVMMINRDGKTRSFDKNACGCAKSEAINVLFLQKKRDALRIYAEVVHVKTEFNNLIEGENGPKYGFYRESEKLAEFLNRFYKEANVDPREVQYIEAVGSATPEADKSELEAIDKVFCNSRSSPLYVGSVMSNIGYSEAASGASSVTKVLLGYHKGLLAANLHCDSPRDDVEGIQKGVMRFMIDHQPFGRGYTAVNNLSVTGVNAHVLLHGHYKPKDLNKYKSNIPYLVTMSGRQQSAVERIINDLKSRPVDAEEIALFHSIHQDRISGHMGRGYIILDTNENNETITVKEKADYFPDVTSPLWFVYSGMGSQWAGMGTQLMRIPVFAKAIQRCHEVLKPKGVDLIHIITSPDKKIFDNILHSFVGIAAVQIGLTDVLTELGIVPDKIIGHSVGELGCAYADGCLTAEEMILSAYSRGLVSVQTPFIKGTMAAVGMGYTQVSKLCPPEIEIACHNSSESATISGPSEIMKKFVESLTAKGIFAKEVPSSNIAYHSRYIAEAGPGLLKYLKEVIKSPSPRSERWVSTSIPQDKWDEPLAKYSSAEYHTNNLLNPVLFEEASALIPPDAVLVEVAPHGLLQAILKRALPASCTNIPLTSRGHKDNAAFMLDAIGKLYMEGYHPRIQALYPKVEFPVSTGTPMLGHLVEWAHTEKWALPLYVQGLKKTAAECYFTLSVHDDEHRYLRGHVVKGKNLYPFSAALVAVWDTFAMSLDFKKKSVSVQMQDIHLFVQPILHDKRHLKLSVSLHRGTGAFEVANEGMVIATGTIIICERSDDNFRLYKLVAENKDEMMLNSEDIYKMLYTRDFNYCDDFQSLQAINETSSEGIVIWKNNWVTFIDGLIQFNALRQKSGDTTYPEYIRKITIDVDNHKVVSEDVDMLTANYFDVFNCTRCGGVLIENLRFRELSIVKNNLSLKSLQFLPHYPKDRTDEDTAFYVILQMIKENVHKKEIIVSELAESAGDTAESKFSCIHKIINDIPNFKVDYSLIKKESLQGLGEFKDVDVIFVNNLSSNDKLCETLGKCLPPNTFIVNKEYTKLLKPHSLFSIVSHHDIGDQSIQLIKWNPNTDKAGISVYTLENSSDMERIFNTIDALPKEQKILLISSYPPIPTLDDLAEHLRKNGRPVNVMVINDELNGNEEFPKSNLAKLVLNNGEWGGIYYLPMIAEAPTKTKKDLILQSRHIGDLNSLEWVDASEPTVPGINVTVHYAGINETDAKKASGEIFYENVNRNQYGMDFSGVTDRGIRVMGLIQGGATRSRVKANPNLLWPVPEFWTLEDAATVPLAYSLAFYCLAIKQKLLPGMRILIHGGTGALGQAAISICLAHNCEVFTTVSDSSKKHLLKRMFPKLKDDHIGNSRDISFGDMVLSSTGGYGCDIILNCVKGDLKNITIKCCAHSGTVLDTGMLQNNEDFSYGMYHMTKSRSFAAVDLSSIFRYENELEMRHLQVLISEGIARGYVRPLTRLTFAPSDAARAFRLLAASRHRGRVLIDMKQNIPNTNHSIKFHSFFSLYNSPRYYHIVISDDDVLAVQLLERLINGGVRKIQLICSKKSNFTTHKIKIWKKLGVQIELTIEGLWDKENISKSLDSDIKHEVEGIYTIITTNNSAYIASTLKDLDSKTRTYPKLKSFAIINENNMIGEDVCLMRRKLKLPATFIKLPHLKKIDNGHSISIKNAIDAIERGLLSERVTIVAHNSSLSDISLLQEISDLADFKIPDAVDETTTLLELRMEPAKAKIVQVYLRDVYNVWLEERQILNLTVLKPGVEGNHARFSVLCERLKLPALVLQPPLRHAEDLHTMAQRFADILLSLTELKNFYLLGYESGAIVALEMAAILERCGLTGVVFCLGGTPNEIKAQFDTNLTQYKDEKALQEGICRHMMMLMSGNKTNDIDNVLQKATTWNEKVTACVRSLLGKVDHSSQYAQELIEAAYSRILHVNNYSVKPKKLKSKLVLLRPKMDISDEWKSILEKDSLQNYSEQPVEEYDLQAPLAYAAQDMRCAGIINRHLEDSILAAFEQRNLCETYLLNADVITLQGVA
ncbi:fatty acid synthase-like [Zerene cesonia]|uniref:fatty acid synthase-like n=1 Tax=Zerene cesonia TaxID=33412 RepID=UPI0018E51AD9|nr:fatty acid synthase-like [Zerene cesonia]